LPVEDFSWATLADGGANLYAAGCGGLQIIHRLDFNNDGYPDLFAQDHHDRVRGSGLGVPPPMIIF